MKVPMGILEVHGSPMGPPRKPHGGQSDGGPIELSYGSHMGVSCISHLIEVPWKSRSIKVSPWGFPGSSMGKTRTFCGASMGFPWYCEEPHGISVQF